HGYERAELFSERLARGGGSGSTSFCLRRHDGLGSLPEGRTPAIVGHDRPDLTDHSGRNCALSVESSANLTSTTRMAVPSADCTRSQMKRESSSPVGTNLPSANSGTSRLMLRWSNRSRTSR